MKMVKSLLLGSAAGLVAVAGAQAADLPVKAKPVQYVKICSLYGAGFYYIPGTDTCVKIGGWVRQQLGYGVNGSMSFGALITNSNDRGTNDYTWRTRGYITADARTQSEYGTIRSYIDVGVDTRITRAGATRFQSNRAFIQFAGFTMGLAQSFYDFMPYAALSYFGGTVWRNADTGDGGRGCGCLHGAVRQRLLGHDRLRSAAQRRRLSMAVPAMATGAAAGLPLPRGPEMAGRGRQRPRRPGVGFGADHGRDP